MSEFKPTESGAEVLNLPEIRVAVQLARDAGQLVVELREKGLDVAYKADEYDPVSNGDKQADALIREGLHNAFPEDEILSEENTHLPESYSGRVWMVDPIDGTKDYIAGGDGSAVMIGACVDGAPELGVVYLPFRDELFFANKERGSFRQGHDGVIYRNQVPDTQHVNQATLVGRRMHTAEERPLESVLESMGFADTVGDGSVGSKIGLIVSGKADAHLSTNLKASKWDTLAPEIILTEAGGIMTDIDGNPLDYTKEALPWERYFLATCTPQLQNEMLTMLAGSKY